MMGDAFGISLLFCKKGGRNYWATTKEVKNLK